jgi:hypothetical protein
LSRRGQLGIDDCVRCKKNTPAIQRQALGCGYEPRSGRLPVIPWQPPTASRSGYSGDPLTVCAGYTCNLPEVREIALSRVHWSKGNAAALGLTEDALDALVVLEGSYNQVQAWIMTPSKDGGGGS